MGQGDSLGNDLHANFPRKRQDDIEFIQNGNLIGIKLIFCVIITSALKLRRELLE